MSDLNAAQIDLIKEYKDKPCEAARDILGVELASPQKLALRAMWIRNNVIIIFNRGAGKCKLPDTVVLTGGGYATLGALHGGAPHGFREMSAMVEGEGGSERSSHTYRNAPEPVHWARTALGMVDDGVAKHRVRTLGKKGSLEWAEMSSIRPGDVMVMDLSGSYRFEGDGSTGAEEAYLLGMMSAGLRRANFRHRSYFARWPGAAVMAAEIADRNGLLPAVKKMSRGYSVMLGGDVDGFLSRFGVRQEDGGWFPPSGSILTGGTAVAEAFLCGKLDACGCPMSKASQCQPRLVRVRTASEEKMLSAMFASLGVLVSASGRQNGDFLVPMGEAAATRGLPVMLPEGGLASVFMASRVRSPGYGMLMEDAANELSLRKRKRICTTQFVYKKKRNVHDLARPADAANLLVELDASEIPGGKARERLREYISRGLFFDMVTETGVLPPQDTYDLCVPGTHTFIANGFISHNTFLDGLFTVLRGMFFPGDKVGIVAPGFRQSKFVFAEVENLYAISKEFRGFVDKAPTRGTDMCQVRFKTAPNCRASLIEALPIGDGTKIRGARYHCILGDETAQIPEDILNLVIRGMMATFKNPMESVRWMAEQKKLLAAGKIDKIRQLHDNKIVYTSTAYYQFNHLWKKVQNYMEAILESAKKNPDSVELRGFPLNADLVPGGQIPYNFMMDENRALCALEYTRMPEGFMNLESIDEARRDMADNEFRMEYCLAAGVPVTTMAGEKPVEMVVPGDAVFTHMGRWGDVGKIFSRWYAGKAVSLKFGDWPEAVFTASHNFCSPSGDIEAVDVARSGVAWLRDPAGWTAVPVRKSSVFDFEGWVHNFSVESDHSYSLPYATVRNCSFFPTDTEGFFSRALLDSSMSHREFGCALYLPKRRGVVNILAADPARMSDNFTMAIFQVLLDRRLVRFRAMHSFHKKPYPYVHAQMRALLKAYNIDEIAMDSGGGGQPVRDLLADEKNTPQGEEIILQRDFDEHRKLKGRRILELVEFSDYGWLYDANHNMKLMLETGMLQMPCLEDLLDGPQDQSAEMLAAMAEISQTVREIQNIVVTMTEKRGNMHWDSPSKKHRKDRYSAVLIGCDRAYTFIKDANKPVALPRGVWIKR
jgi:hypothetical protein